MAQDISGTNLATNWDDPVVAPACKVYAGWNWDGDFDDTGEDITDRVKSVTITHRLLDEIYGLPALGGGRPSTAVITLNNAGHYFSPENTATGLAGTYTSIGQRLAYRVLVKIEMGYNDPVNGDELLTQFTGRIEAATPVETPGRREIVYTCKGYDGFIEKFTRSTVVQQDQRIDTIIAGHLTAAAIVDQDLDMALFTQPFEWMDDDNLLQHLQNLAAADGGWLYWSKEGQARFERATHWLEGSDHRTAVATLTEGRCTRQSNEVIWRNVYKSVLVRYANIAAGPRALVYQSTEPIEVAPASTETITCQFSSPVTSVVTPEEGDDYEVTTPLGSAMTSHCVATIDAKAQQADVSFTNDHASLSLVVRKYALEGYTIVTSEYQQVRVETTLGLIDGEREYRAPDNPWIVRKEQAEFVANRMLSLLERPREIITWYGRLCPYLELGDRIHIENAAQGLDADCYVVGLKMDYARSARMELTLLPCAGVFPEASYFQLGVSDYAAISDPVYH